MKTWELVKDFQLKMPELVKAMHDSNHHFDEKNLNKFHLEGSVLTHVLMTMLMAETHKVGLVPSLAVLCHDLGKPLSRTVVDEPGKKVSRFFNHDGMGSFLSIDYLNTLPFLSKEEKVRITSLISIHTYLYTVMREEKFESKVIEKFAGELDLFKDLVNLTKCDALGRFAENEDRSIWENADEYFSNVTKQIQPVIPIRETKGEVTILIGVPGSGKSTWVKANGDLSLILSRDEVIMEMGEGKNYTEAYQSLDAEKVNIEFDKRRREAIKSGRDLIFDMTHMTAKSRRRSLQGLPKSMKRKAVVFLVGYKTLLERNEKRALEEGKNIPHHVLLNMMGNYSVPLRSEGFDEIEFILE